MNDIKTYGKYVLTGAVGVGLGFGAFTASDTPTEQTQLYQNLQEDLNNAQDNSDDYEATIADLETTVTDKEDKISNLEDQVKQFNSTVEELREDNVELEDAVVQAQERVGLVDYLPVFQDEDVEFNGDIITEVDQEVTDGEGDYDSLDVDYTDSEGGDYDVTITQYEESEDADDAVEDFRENYSPVEFTADGDEHTVELSGYTGNLEKIQFNYDDSDAIEDVDHEDEIESVVVDGEDITDRVSKVKVVNGDDVRVHFDEAYYVNDGETVKVTYSDATDEGDFDGVQVDDGSGFGSEYEYDQNSDSREDIYRDGDTVVEIFGDRNGDQFEAQYTDLTSQYE